MLPRDISDVLETLHLCRRFGAPVLARGGGTSLAGQCCNVAVVLDFSKYMHRILDLDAKRGAVILKGLRALPAGELWPFVERLLPVLRRIEIQADDVGGQQVGVIGRNV